MAVNAKTVFPTITNVVSEFRKTGRSAKTRSVCWVTDEMVGLFRNGGGATVVSGWCAALVAGGHKVEVLYTAPADRHSAESIRTIREWKAQGVEITFLNDFWHGGSLSSRSYAVHGWLKEQSFDIVHFHDFNGSAFAACNAKRMGIGYTETLLCVSNFGTARWGWECMELYLQAPHDLEKDWLEQRAIANADVLICQSQYMANWLLANDYELPQSTFVQPSMIAVALGGDGPAGKTTTPVREITFFGRQEVRKGLRIFVEAAEKLGPKYPQLKFTFSGKFSRVDFEHSGAYILSRLRQLPNDITFLAHLGRDQALAHLKGAEVLAVMPSIDDNFPGTVIEAVQEGIEFIASNSGGIPEIVRPADHADRLFAPTTKGLVDAVERVLKERPPCPHLAFDLLDNVATWMDWHAMVPIEVDDSRALAEPLVSVCLVHYNRPRMAAMAIDGLKAQTYRNFELIFVDDGSTQAAAQRFVDELESQDLPFPVKVCRTPDIRLGAARNAGAAMASGEYVVFVDDDNVPRSEMLEVMVRAAESRQLDAGTCLAYILSGSGEPGESANAITGYFPAGGPLAQGMVQNVFGDANAIVRRSKFLEVGGFDPTPGIGAEDWDFFVKLVLAGGRLEPIPQALYWYRQHDQQLTTRWHSTHLYHERILTSFLDRLDGVGRTDLRDALRVYMGRPVLEHLGSASWHNVGVRPYGEHQRQLIPHVDNIPESYKMLSQLCLEMGRFRDAANLIMFGEHPHAHLMQLGESINRRYAEGASDFPQGYYGEGTAQTTIALLPASLRSIRWAMQGLTSDNNPISYDESNGSMLVHPIGWGRSAIAVIEGACPESAKAVTASIAVGHPSGPEVVFKLLLVDNVTAKSLQGYDLPTNPIASASAQIGPEDGARNLTVTVPASAEGSLSIILATDAADRTDHAWARFWNLRISIAS